MAKPQQPELRRSGTVPALDPDATEAVLSAQDDPKTSSSRGPVPDEQQRGHHPEDEQDKPDLDAFAERLGIPAEGEEPDEDEDDVETEGSEPAPALNEVLDDEPTPAGPPSFIAKLPLPVKLALVGPAVTYVGVRGVYRTVTRIVCRRDE